MTSVLRSKCIKPIPPRAQGLLTEVWQRRKRQSSRLKIFEQF